MHDRKRTARKWHSSGTIYWFVLCHHGVSQFIEQKEIETFVIIIIIFNVNIKTYKYQGIFQRSPSRKQHNGHKPKRRKAHHRGGSSRLQLPLLPSLKFLPESYFFVCKNVRMFMRAAV